MRSMTGYGSGAAEAPSARVTVEVRSLNQRFLDVRVTAPREYAAFEREVRDRVRAVAERGRVEVTITRSAQAARRRYAVTARLELARAYVAAARDLGRRLRVDGDVSIADVLRMPDLFEVREVPAETRGEHATLKRALSAALRAFDGERRREGAHLHRDMRQRVAHLKQITTQIRRRLPAAIAALREQVEERLVGAADLDRSRVAQEVAALAERSDVTEELVRLEAHLAALAAALGAAGSVGKRIEFLLQEVQRELNTTSAKAGDPHIVDLALVAKGEVERLREQVQNVE